MLPRSGSLAVRKGLSVPDTLEALVRSQMESACNWPDPHRDALIAEIHRRYGNEVHAILIYGSYLRGNRDTLLDFYVLLNGYAGVGSRAQAVLAGVLPPNVYQVVHGTPPDDIRAKLAVMTLARFEAAMKRDFHSYFWGRFTQPCGLLYYRDDAVRERVVAAVAQACSTFTRRVLPQVSDPFTAADLVATGLSLSYRCELRSEPPGHAGTLYAHNERYYQNMLALLSSQLPVYRETSESGVFEHATPAGHRLLDGFGWWLRRVQGKVLSVLRLLKASLTFAGGFEYLLWKISRHSNIELEPTTRQRKYPLIFAWPLLWQLYRRGAFR